MKSDISNESKMILEKARKSGAFSESTIAAFEDNMRMSVLLQIRIDELLKKSRADRVRRETFA